MFARLFNKNQNAFGLDISESSFKLFEFEYGSKRGSVKGYCNVPLPKGVMNGEAILDQVTFGHLLKQAMEKPQFGKIDTKYVVANLPETKSFVRVIQIPRMSELEADSAVPFEAENFIPLPIDQVYLDWQKLGETGDKMNVLIIASPKDFVDNYLNVLEKLGLRPVALEVESQSCQRALVNPEAGETLLVVDMADARSSLIMIEEGNLQFTSTIPVAGSMFTESIARSLGIAGAKAEMIKQAVGIANTAEYPNIKTALLPVLANLTAEVKNILRFYGEHSEKAVSKIVLAGGSAQLQNLVEFLAPEFAELPGLRVELGNPWQNAKNIGTPPLDAIQALPYTTAIGLALRGQEL